MDLVPVSAGRLPLTRHCSSGHGIYPRHGYIRGPLALTFVRDCNRDGGGGENGGGVGVTEGMQTEIRVELGCG